MRITHACSICDRPLVMLEGGGLFCWSCDGHMSGLDADGRPNVRLFLIGKL